MRSWPTSSVRPDYLITSLTRPRVVTSLLPLPDCPCLLWASLGPWRPSLRPAYSEHRLLHIHPARTASRAPFCHFIGRWCQQCMRLVLCVCRGHLPPGAGQGHQARERLRLPAAAGGQGPGGVRVRQVPLGGAGGGRPGCIRPRHTALWEVPGSMSRGKAWELPSLIFVPSFYVHSLYVFSSEAWQCRAD